MLKPAMFSLSCLGLLLATPASATQQVCPYVSPQKWMPVAMAEARGRTFGIDVAYVQPDGGCWTVYGRHNGRRVEMYLHPVTGEVVHTERKSH